MIKLTEQTVFANRYQFQRLLGRGGFSEVWLAIDQMTNLEIAVKVYAPGYGMDTDGMADFCKELSQVYNLNHTNLLKPQHVDSWEGMPYLVMTYCPKGSCHRLIGTMQEEQIWKLLYDVASGLAYLHEQDIIHQDIKPDNILVDPLGHYVITDFGISVQSRSTLRKSMNVASSSGTTAYMGPERFSKDPKPIKASDIWSLGATIYELITGNAPFGEIGGGLQKSGADLPTITKNISPALRQTIALMLAEDPWERPTALLLADWADNPSTIELAIQNSKSYSLASGDSSLKISPQFFDMDIVGGEQTLSIKTSEQWRFFYDDKNKWFHVEKQGNDKLKIRYESNQTGEQRSATINIIAGARAATIDLTQKSLPKRSKKAIYILFSIIGALILIIGSAMYHHYYIAIPKRLEKFKIIYAEQYRLSNGFIASMSPKDDEKKLYAPIFAIAKLEDLERTPLFIKLQEVPQSDILQSIYLDSLISIQSQLNLAIKQEKKYIKNGIETTWLKNQQKKKKSIDNTISLFNDGKTVTDISEHLKSSQR